MDDDRFDRLEAALARRGELLARQAAALDAAERSAVGRVARLCRKLAARALPATVWRAGDATVRGLLDAADRLLTATGHDPLVPRGPRTTPPTADEYARWIARHEPTPAALARQRRHAFPQPPLVSLVVPTGGVLGGLREQTYRHAEVVEDAAHAAGELVALAHAGDRLAPHALFELARAAAAHPDADVFFTDEDRLDADGRRGEPYFKPAWSPLTARFADALGGLTAVRRRALGRLRPECRSAAWYDAAVRAAARNPHVVHVPGVMYHARRPRRPRPEDLAAVAAGPPPDVRLKVSVVIPNRDQPAVLDRCLRSLARTREGDVEILVVENGSRDPDTFAVYRRWERDGVRVLTWDRPFNYAAINNHAARAAAGELLLFLNNDVEADAPGWIGSLAALAARPEVGAVGAKLLYADDTIQHAGVVLGVRGVAGHAWEGFPRAHPGVAGRLTHAQECTAVTGACLMVRRAAFDRAGGFDEGYAVAYNDVDLCLALRACGYRNAWTPGAELYHLESATRGADDTPERAARLRAEVARLRRKWGKVIDAGDPFYSRHYRTDRADFSLRV